MDGAVISSTRLGVSPIPVLHACQARNNFTINFIAI